MNTRPSREALGEAEAGQSNPPEPGAHAALNHFTVLDSWRGLCALIVALRHLPVESHFYQTEFLRNSYLFVDFFFVLSGFVITHNYAHKLKDGRDAAEFAVRRFARLWPLHMVMLLGFAALMTIKLVIVSVFDVPVDQPPFTGIYSVGGLITSTLFIHPFVHSAPVWNRPSWSVGTEVYTYLLFAAVCLVAERLASGRQSPAWLKALFAVGLVIISASVLAIFSPGMDVTTGLALFRCIFGFFLGHLVYRLWQLQRISVTGAAVTEIFVVALVAAFVTAAGYGALSLLAPFLFAVVIGVFAQEKGPVSRLMLAPAFVCLGRWSYAIYMIHAFIFTLLIAFAQVFARDSGPDLVRLVPNHGEGGLVQALVFPDLYTGDVLAIVLLVQVVAFAGLAYVHIERPAQRTFNRLLLPFVGIPREPPPDRQVLGLARMRKRPGRTVPIRGTSKSGRT